MSACVLSQNEINLLTRATNAALELNKKYPGSYHLHEDTIRILGKYAGDLHNLYRALFIANIKAVNGRYGENEKTLPKYLPLQPWDISRLNRFDLKKACGKYADYMYQLSEDPIYGSEIWNCFQDIRKLLCSIYVGKVVDWSGNDI